MATDKGLISWVSGVFKSASIGPAFAADEYSAPEGIGIYHSELHR